MSVHWAPGAVLASEVRESIVQSLGMRERKLWACSLPWHDSQDRRLIDMHRDYSTQEAITVFSTTWVEIFFPITVVLWASSPQLF